MKNALSILILGVFCAASASAAEVRYTGAAGRDPFAGAVERVGSGEDPFAAEKRLRSLVVQGVVASSANPRVIINGKIYRVGSEVMPGTKITRIAKDGVFVTSGDKEIMLSRPMQPIKGKS